MLRTNADLQQELPPNREVGEDRSDPLSPERSAHLSIMSSEGMHRCRFNSPQAVTEAVDSLGYRTHCSAHTRSILGLLDQGYNIAHQEQHSKKTAGEQ